MIKILFSVATVEQNMMSEKNIIFVKNAGVNYNVSWTI